MLSAPFCVLLHSLPRADSLVLLQSYIYRPLLPNVVYLARRESFEIQLPAHGTIQWQSLRQSKLCPRESNNARRELRWRCNVIIGPGCRVRVNRIKMNTNLFFLFVIATVKKRTTSDVATKPLHPRETISGKWWKIITALKAVELSCTFNEIVLM